MGKINRCICSNITFEEIKAIAEKNGFTTVNELRDEKICACHCMLCAPYIKDLLKTGKTAFDPKPVFESSENE